MLPTLFEIGPIKIHSFGLMMALSFLVTTIMAGREFRRRGLDPDHANEAGLGAMIGGVLGAKIYYLIDHWSDLLEDPAGMIFSGSGLTWYGGLIGGTIGALLVARWRRIPLILLCDIAAPILPVGYAIGRMGCFLNGDDYGRPTDAPWGMEFPKGTPPTPPGVAVHPTQLYEVGAAIVMYLILTRLRDSVTRPGALFGIYLLLAGLERFGVEFVRTNEPGLLGLTFAQWISVGLMLAGIVLFARPAEASPPDGREPRDVRTLPA
jgi:phosphatidylglycerol---prolipoprotein diacylglyceryl transferase